ncbi:hypothetical protein LXL04_008824 [Taraxacum kok-saghyz]
MAPYSSSTLHIYPLLIATATAPELIWYRGCGEIRKKIPLVQALLPKSVELELGLRCSVFISSTTNISDQIRSETMFESMMLDHQKQKEELNKKFLELERVLDAKQELEMEIEDLEGKVQAMEHLGDEDDDAVKEKIKTMNNELKSTVEETDDMENLIQTHVVKERQSNDELQEARKELIYDMLSGPANIGIKRMGEIDMKAFHDACNEKFEHEEAQIKAFELCSLWQDKLKTPEWHLLIVFII